MLRDLSEWVDQVKEGHAVAQAAYYANNKERLQKIYDQYYCKKNCGFEVTPVGVPYAVHRRDMAKLAPVWKDMVARMFEDMTGKHSGPGPAPPAWVVSELKVMGGAWCVEMFG
jgi:hypothetical protein